MGVIEATACVGITSGRAPRFAARSEPNTFVPEEHTSVVSNVGAVEDMVVFATGAELSVPPNLVRVLPAVLAVERNGNRVPVFGLQIIPKQLRRF